MVFSSNVINPTANNVPECYNNILATGTPKNKENLKLLIDQIRSNGGTQYAPALKAAFKLLNTDEPSSGTEHRTQAKGICLTKQNFSVHITPKLNARYDVDHDVQDIRHRRKLVFDTPFTRSRKLSRSRSR